MQTQNQTRRRIHIGYTRTGRSRWRYFNDLAAALVVANEVFDKTGVVIGIEAAPNRN